MATNDSPQPVTAADARRAWLASLLLRREQTWFGRFAARLSQLTALGRGRRRRLERKAAVSLAGAALLLSLGIGAMRPPAVHAATITVDGVICTLVDAVTAANSDTATGGCITGSGADTIDLQTNVTLTVANNSSYLSYTGLPVVTTDITIEGNGNTIARDGAAAVFRILAVSSTGSLTLNDTTLSGGYAQYSGGGIFNAGGYVRLQGSTVSGNVARFRGGGIYNDGELIIDNSLIDDNRVISGTGGGINSEDGATATITNSTISRNYSSFDGGGVYNDGQMTIANSLITGNNGSDGGGLYNNDGTTTITDSTITDNTGRSQGGGLYNDTGTLTVINSTVSGNRAGLQGGGLYIWGSTTVTKIVNSTISGNVAGSEGGGIYHDRGTLTITNSTITGNTATTSGGGLYLYNESPEAVATIVNSIISGNTAVEDGNEIFSNNGTITADAYNVFGDNSQSNATAFYNFSPGASDAAATSDGVMPTPLAGILDPTLQNNGGPTETHALVAGSPAIDRGPTAACAADPVFGADQRGQPRSIDIPGTGDDGGANLCDTGAFEVQLPAPISFCPVDNEDVAYLMTDLLGVGQGSPKKGVRTRKLVIPNYQDVASLYGQLASVESGGVMKYVRFRYPNGTYEQIHAPTSPAYRTFAVNWWGSELETGHKYIKGQFFWGAKGSKTPRAFVLWPTYNTTEEYANVFTVFDESIENHVAWEPGFIQTQTQTITIPETRADGATVTVKVALVDNDKDDRPIRLTVTVDGFVIQKVIYEPDAKDTLNLETFVFDNVGAGVDKVEIELKSSAPDVNDPAGGDSAAIIGAAVSYACEVPAP